MYNHCESEVRWLKIYQSIEEMEQCMVLHGQVMENGDEHIVLMVWMIILISQVMVL
jgi:hypothetical protein